MMRGGGGKQRMNEKAAKTRVRDPKRGKRESEEAPQISLLDTLNVVDMGIQGGDEHRQ